MEYPLVQPGDSVVKKLLFRPNDKAESACDAVEEAVLPMEAERSPIVKKTIKKLKKPKPVVESSSFTRNQSNDQPRSLTKLRKLKPIALSQVQI